MAEDATHLVILSDIPRSFVGDCENHCMETSESGPRGFGTTSSEWELLRLAYSIAVEVSQGKTPGEEVRAKFRYLDESGNLMFESWWNSRPEF